MKSIAKFATGIEHLLKSIPNSSWYNNHQFENKYAPTYLGCISGSFVAIEVIDSEEAIKKASHQQSNLKYVERAKGKTFIVWPEIWGDVYSQLYSMGQK